MPTPEEMPQQSPKDGLQEPKPPKRRGRRASRKDPLTKLTRGDDVFAIHPKTWCDILLLASRQGWQPSVPIYWFLAQNVEMTDADAKSLVRVWDGVLDDAKSLALRLTVQGGLGEVEEIVIDLSRLCTVRNFCNRGGFWVRGGA